MRAKLLTIPILLLLTVAIFSQTLITPIAGVEYPAIYVEPSPIEPPTTYAPGVSFTVYIWTNYTDASDIWGYEFALSWNPLVLNCTEVVNGNLIVNNTYTATFTKGVWDNNAGTFINSTGCYFDFAIPTIPTTGGPGILANVTFKVVDWGDSDIAFGSAFLIGGDGTLIVDIDTMPNNIGHGYFCNVDPAPTHDIIVTNVSPNLTKVLAPTPVGINVTVLNDGTVPERFTVKVYYDLTLHGFLIGETLVDELASETSILLPFTWDTTYVEPGVEQGNHTIIAIAKPWAESKINPETNEDNNRNETAWVTVYSPTLAVLPESTKNPDLETYSVSIYTDYNATEVVGSPDVKGYNLTLTYNASILQGVSVGNGGNMIQTDKWVGDNSETIYNTTITPVVADSETVYVNRTKMKKGGPSPDYSIVYSTGQITFATAPDYVLVEVEYWYQMNLMAGATFSAGTFNNTIGELSLTTATVATPVSGPGVLATVNFTVVDNIGESDIELGPETVLIGSGSTYNITMPHRLKPGYFTNRGDAAMTQIQMDKAFITAYPTWSLPINVTVLSQNVWGAPNFTVIIFYGAAGVAEKQAANRTVTNLAEGGKDTWNYAWYLENVTWGEYTVSAKVVVPTGDHDLTNDEDSDGTITVKIPGDIDGDWDVDPDDFSSFRVAYGSKGPPQVPVPYENYDDQADFDIDGDVDPDDFSTFRVHYGTIV